MYLGGTGWRIVTAANVASRDWERTLIWQLYRHSTSGPTAAESVSVSERQGWGRKGYLFEGQRGTVFQIVFQVKGLGGLVACHSNV